MSETKRRVIIESPFGGNEETNTVYARAALFDSLSRGEAPIASHLLYPQVLNDRIPEQRKQGIDAGLAWRAVADCAVFYIDLGWSPGMVSARDLYDAEAKPYELRSLDHGAGA